MNKYIGYIIAGMMGLNLSVGSLGLGAQQAPLVYEYNLKGPLTMESEIITTAGTIKSISASAEFSGEVRLEASANGGSAYTRIINGVPLAEGFIPGNQLRFRANIAQESILQKLTLGYTDTSGAVRLFSNPDLAGFKFHQPIYISGASAELFNYPLKIKIEKDIFSQGIYFTAADKETPLYYYVEGGAEKGLIPSQGTDPFLWVRIPEIPKEGTRIYLYYGNKEGLSPQALNPLETKGTVPLLEAQGTVPFLDGNKVFSFFDDFNGTVLDEAKWQARPELKGKYSLQDGYLKLTGCAVIGRDFQMKKGILEFKAKAEKDAAIQAIAHGAKAPHSIYPSEEMVYSSGYPGAEHTIAINDVAKLNIGKAITPLTDYIYQAILNDSGIIFQRYAQDYTKQAEIRFLDGYRNEAGYIGLRGDGALTGAGSVYFDWVRVRPYVETEPQVIGGGGR